MSVEYTYTCIRIHYGIHVHTVHVHTNQEGAVVLGEFLTYRYVPDQGAEGSVEEGRCLVSYVTRAQTGKEE